MSIHLREFKGVEVNSRTFREYPYGKLTSHFLGYIGRISDKDKEMLEEEGLTALYRGSTHIGKSGLENITNTSFMAFQAIRKSKKTLTAISSAY